MLSHETISSETSYQIQSENGMSDIPLRKVHVTTLKRLIQAIIREQILEFELRGNDLIFMLPNCNKELIIENIKMASMNRCVSYKRIYEKTDMSAIVILNNPFDLLKLLQLELEYSLPDAQWKGLYQEIIDHTRNALLSHHREFYLHKKIKREAQEHGLKKFIEWLNNSSEFPDKQVFWEQIIYQGHPHHPCSKTKLGFSAEDVIKYSPEFNPEVQLPVLAIRKDHLHIESVSPTEYETWFSVNYPAAWENFKKELFEKKQILSQYLPIPVHLWQAENRIRELFAALIDQEILILLSSVTINATPTLSFRSLVPVDNPESAYIKLPVDVQATSIKRTLAPASILDSIRTSDLIEKILKEENYFNGRLYSLREKYGVHIKSFNSEYDKHLSAIFRESVQSNLAKDEICIVVAALSEKSPVSGLSILIEMVQIAGVKTLKEAINYFKKYVDLALGSYLSLFLVYGISLEAHQQNTLAVFSNGFIKRFIARDFSGIDMHRPSLKRKSLNVDLDARFLTDDREHVRNEFLHSLYQSHLGELILLLSNHFECEEKLFWDVVLSMTQQQFEINKEKMDPQTWEADYRAILIDDWSCKALVRMRLFQKEYSKGQYFPIPNPLIDLR